MIIINSKQKEPLILAGSEEDLYFEVCLILYAYGTRISPNAKEINNTDTNSNKFIDLWLETINPLIAEAVLLAIEEREPSNHMDGSMSVDFSGLNEVLKKLKEDESDS